jgi:GAF domain-containing protein
MDERETTVRFDEELWSELERRARAEGVSVAEFVREAAAERVADPVQDPARLQALRDSGLLGVREDPAFDRLTRLATRLLGAPIALVSLVAADRQVFASCTGLDEPWATDRSTPLSDSFCRHAVASREPLVVEDAPEHPVLRDLGLVRGGHIVAYAGIPLIDPDGHALGTLCVFDTRPRAWTEDEVQTLADLARSVLTEIELRRA